MYADVSKDFVVETEKPSRKFEARIKINGKWYTDIKSLSIISGSCDEDNITIGSAVSSYIEVTMSDIGELFENTEIELQYGIVISDGSIEYIPMGYFTVQRPEDDNGYVKFTAYDRMAKLEKMYTSKLTYPATAIQVIDEICSQCGIIRETIGLGTVYVQTKPEGYTCREVIGYMASLFGKFAVIGRNGKLQIRFYEDSGYNVQMCRTFSLKKNQSDYAVGFLTCNTNSSTQLTAGSGSRGIVFDNPFITQERLEELYQVLEGFTYRPATIKFLGNIRIDVWDLITTTDLTGNVYKIPVMKITQKFDGGVVTTIEASGKTEEEINTDFKGPVTKGLERTYTELLLANTIIATKVDAEWVKANTVTADKIEAVNADIANIHANMLTTNEADIKYATITSLEAEKARITVLEAGSADIGILKTQVADINTLMFGTASGGSLTTEFSNSVVSLIGDAQIKSAMIKDITADKIISGKLYTNLVEVCSQSGNLDIADNTIMIKDNAEVVRVQLGKDASGDYNMYIWDKSGKLMFDALGLTESGIKREIIRNDMISETANISAKKLDINSLFTEINGSTETIKANRIYVDADNQTLDVAFKTMSTSVTTATTTANTALSSAVSAENAINGLEIGGRNLLKGTHNKPINYSYPETTYDDKFNCVTTAPLNGENYTLSFWAKSTVEGDKITVYFYNPSNVISVVGSQGQYNTNADGNCEFSLTTVLSKYWVNYTIPKGGNNTKNVMIPRMFKDKGSGVVTIQWEKLEEGNKATDWTPAPEDVDSSVSAIDAKVTTLTETVSTQGTQLTTVQGQISSKIWQQDITTAVTELEIGGRNLFHGSQKFNITNAKSFGSSKSWITDETYNGLTVRRYGYSWNFYRPTISLEPGNYVFSGYAKGTNNKVLFLQAAVGDIVLNYDAHNVTNDWKRYGITFKLAEKSDVTFYFELRENGGDIYECGWKLEKGDKPTDWTPAPEDVDSSLTALEGTTTTLTNQYTSLNQSLTSLTATVSGNTTAISQKADGGTVTALQSNLTALQADLTGYKTAVSENYTTKTEFNGLQIGGRNLFPNSGFVNDRKYWYFYNATWEVQDCADSVSGKAIKITSSGSGMFTRKGGTVVQTETFNVGDLLTLSGYVKGTTGDKITINYEGAGAAVKEVSVTENWQYFVYSITVKNAFSAITFYAQSGTTFYLKDLKLEYGNKATDWSPAPEDVDSSIAEVDGKFANYSTTTAMNSAIEQKAGSVLQTVSGTYATQDSLGNYATTQSVTASLALKIDKTDNNQIVSMINASADVIRLTADRFILDSTYSKINQDGTVQFTGGNIGGFTIDGNGLFNVQNGVGCGMQKFGLGSAFWAGPGGVGNGGENAEFKVWHDGSVFAQKLYVTGGSMNINNNFIVDINGNLVSKGAADFQCATVYSNDFHSRGSMYVANNLDVGSTIGCNTLQVKNNMYVSNIFYYWYDGAWVTLRDYISAIVNGG